MADPTFDPPAEYDPDAPADDGGVAVAPAPKKTPPGRPKRYAVVVQDDDEHTFPYVVEVLRKVCGHKKEEAEKLTRRIDTTGRAIVWTGPLEVAELKRDQIVEFGPDTHPKVPVTFPLGVVLEPIPDA